MQLLYFCMLLSAVAIPTLPMVFGEGYGRALFQCLSSFFNIASPYFIPHQWEPRWEPLGSLVAMLMLVAAYGAVGLSIERQMNQQLRRGKRPRDIAENYSILKRLAQWSWVLFAPFFLAAAGWGTVPRTLLPNLDSLSWSLAIWVFPSLLLTVLYDSQSLRWRRRLNKGLDSKQKPNQETLRSQKQRPSGNLESTSRIADWSMLWADARHTWLMIFALPVLGCVAIDAATFSSHWFGLSNSAQYFLGAIAIFSAVAFIPNAMLWIWSTEPLEGIEDNRSPISTIRVAWIKQLWRWHAPNSPRVLYWSTNHRYASAMVVGWLPPMRCLVLSDALLERLNDEELRMVILHEAAHVHRFHICWRFVPVFLGTILLAFWFQPASYLQILESVPGYAYWIHGSATLGLVVLLLKAISITAKWTELDADRHAIELSTMRETKADLELISRICIKNGMHLISGEPKAPRSEIHQERSKEPLKSAAKAMISSLEKTVPKSYHDAGGWLHPSVNARRLRIVQQYFIEAYSLVESEAPVNKGFVPTNVDIAHQEVATCPVGAV